MAEFERGDVVAYSNPQCPEYIGVGVVTRVDDPDEGPYKGYSLWVTTLTTTAAFTHLAEMDTPWRADVWCPRWKGWSMTEFRKGDIVRVEYSSPRLLDEWLSGHRPIGPGDVGIVTFATGNTGSQWVTDVTVEFPMIGCYGVHSANLRLVQRAGENS